MSASASAPVISLSIAPRPTVQPRRPREALEILCATDDGFRQAIRELESCRLFQALRAGGYIRKAPLRGWIPADRYWEFLDSTALTLITSRRVAEHAGWLADFGSTTPERIAEVADRYRVTLEEAVGIARYARSVLEDTGSFGTTRPCSPRSEQARRLAAPSESPLHFLRSFVERYSLSPDELRCIAIEGTETLEAAARRIGADPRDIELAREAAASVLIAEQSDDVAGRTRAPRGTGQDEFESIARVVVDPLGVPQLAFRPDDEYAQTYRLTPDAMKAIGMLASSRGEAEALLRSIRHINQRKALVHRVLAAIVRAQARYLRTGDEQYLAPVTQADIAREIGEPRSTVCRLVRDRWIEYGGKLRPVTTLLQSKSEVIGRLLTEFEGLSDAALAQVLKRRFGATLSRRTIAYHRQQLERKGRLAGDLASSGDAGNGRSARHGVRRRRQSCLSSADRG